MITGRIRLIRHCAGWELRRLVWSLEGLGVWLVFLLTYGLAVHQAYTFNLLAQFATVQRALASMNAVDLFLVPFAGILLGYTALAGEIESGTAQFLLSKPVRRSDVVLGKLVGRGLYLGLVWLFVTLGSVLWMGRVIRNTRNEAGVPVGLSDLLGGFEGVVLYPFSLFLLSLSFLGISLLASAWVSRNASALSLSVGAFAVLGIGWNTLVPIGSDPSVAGVLLKLGSPFNAWLQWSNQLLGQPAAWVETYRNLGHPEVLVQPVFYLGVILLWLVGCLMGGCWGFSRRDIP